jgi:hypothetical protein
MLDRASALALFSGWTLIHFDETEGAGNTAKRANKHWHLFDLVAR